MTAKENFDPREASVSMRDNMRTDPHSDQDYATALYHSAYEPGSGGGFKSDCFPRDFPRNLPDFNGGGDMEIPRCWPLPGLDDSRKPTEAQTSRAETKLDAGINGLIPDSDRQNLKDANHALLTGDAAALAGVYEKYKDDPAKLNAFIEEQNRELKDAKSDVSVQTNDEGKILISKSHGGTAVELDPATGDTAVRKVMHDPSGNIYVGDKVDNADVGQTLDRISNHAVNDINRPDFRFSFALHHDRFKGHFRHAFLLNAQDDLTAQDGAEDFNDINQPQPPNGQVMFA